MSKDFTIHLVSNVSPDLFPNNNATKFSTLLADELDLSDGQWEVGVRQIMYPTHVATTGSEDKISIYEYEEDYRNLLPRPPRNINDLTQMGAVIDLLHPTVTTVGTSRSTDESLTPVTVTAGGDLEVATAAKAVLANTHNLSIETILSKVNLSQWAQVKNILKLEYSKKHRKFILNLYHDDIVLVFSKKLQRLLGFREDSYTKGTHWAWSKFNNSKIIAKSLKLFLFDLQTLESESHQLLKTYFTTSNQLAYIKSIPYNFKDTLSDDYYAEPKIHFGVYPYQAQIKIKPEQTIPAEHAKHAKRLIFYKFDSKTTEKLGLKSIYAHYNQKIVPIPTIKESKEQLTQLCNDLSSVEVTLYYAHVREVKIDLKQAPTTSFSIETKKEIKKPADLLPVLNSKSKVYDYKFTYNKYIQRFEIQTGKKYGIELSPTLSSILGFDYKKLPIFDPEIRVRAAAFPVLDRAITALYVYTNIINPVYIGDVQSPLLLACPFKLDNRINNVIQQEFLNPVYTTLNRSKVQLIDIAIFDDAGVAVPFLYGKSKISLHFRRLT